MSRSLKSTHPERLEDARRLDRRAFIKAAALAAGALALPGRALAAGDGASEPLALGNHPASVKASLRLGVLLPERSVLPGMNEQFLGGMQLACDQALRQGYQVSLLPEQVSVGGGNAVQKGLGLVEQQRAGMLVAMLNPQVAEALAQAMEKHGLVVLAAEAGGDLPPSRPAANLFYHTLGYWQSSLALGGWAAANLGKRAAMMASLYESGFDALYAFQAGFEAASGEVVHTQVTHASAAAVNWGEALAAAQQAQPDFIYAQYSGNQAVEFSQAYRAAGLTRRLPLAISGTLAADGKITAPYCAGWSRALASRENLSFVRNFRMRYRRLPDSFAALGYEAAQAVLAVLQVSGGRSGLGNYQAAFEALRFNGLRGPLSMDAGTHSLNGPLYLNGIARQTPTSLAVAPAALEQVAQLQQNVRTGWLHAYYSM